MRQSAGPTGRDEKTPSRPWLCPAATHENRASELMLEHLTGQGVTARVELVLVDRGVTAAAARTPSRLHDLEVRRVGWGDKQLVFRPVRHAWRVELAHGRLGRSRRDAVVREHHHLRRHRAG
jgi:hypothetical protein